MWKKMETLMGMAERGNFRLAISEHMLSCGGNVPFDVISLLEDDKPEVIAMLRNVQKEMEALMSASGAKHNAQTHIQWVLTSFNNACQEVGIDLSEPKESN